MQLHQSNAESLLDALREINTHRDKDGNDVELSRLSLLSPDEWHAKLFLTQDGIVCTANRIVTLPISALFNLSQCPIDVSRIIQKLFQLATKVSNDSKLKESSKFKEDAVESNNCGFLSDNFDNYVNLETGTGRTNHQDGFRASHEGFVDIIAFTAAVTGLLGTAVPAAGLSDTIGNLFRELQALAVFNTQETDKKDDNVYSAFQRCCSLLTKHKDTDECLQALFALQAAIEDFKGAEIMTDKSVSGPYCSVLTRYLISDPFVTSLAHIIERYKDRNLIKALEAPITGVNTAASTTTLSYGLQVAVDKQIEACAILADENKDHGFEAFFKILIKLLGQTEGLQAQDKDYDDLIQRLNWGGIALASFHSNYKGLWHLKAYNEANTLITEDSFLGCTQAPALLDRFITKAIEDQRTNPANSLLKQFKSELTQNSIVSAKVNRYWRYIVESVVNHLNDGRYRLNSRAQNYSYLKRELLDLRPALHEKNEPPRDLSTITLV